MDGAGNAYVTGWTASTDFPTANPLQATNAGGAYDAFVAKLNPAGSALVYSTYLGSGAHADLGARHRRGRRRERLRHRLHRLDRLPHRQSAPARQRAAAPTTPSWPSSTPTGSALVYSTYLGGSDADQAIGIAVDAAGNAYVTGYGDSTDFPTVGPLQAAQRGMRSTPSWPS